MNCLIQFPVPFVGCDFCVSATFDYTAIFHLIWGFIIAFGIMFAAGVKAGFYSSVFFTLAWELHGGCCSAKGMNLVDLGSGWLGAIGFIFIMSMLHAAGSNSHAG